MAGNWSNVVTIELNGDVATYARIQTTKDAAYYLLDHWTGAKTPEYRVAIESCSRALKGDLSDDDVCMHFVAAAREAQLTLVTRSDQLAIEGFEADILMAVEENLLADLHAVSSSLSK